MRDEGKKFCADYAKRRMASCRKCKAKIDKGLLRIAKIVPNPFTDAGDDMKEWYHLDCIFESFQRARATTRTIEDAEDIEGFKDLEKNDRKKILVKIDELQNKLASKSSGAQKTLRKFATKRTSKPIEAAGSSSSLDESQEKRMRLDQFPNERDDLKLNEINKDNSFKEFRKLCAKLYEEPAYTKKTAIVRNLLQKGTSGHGFEGNTYLWVKFLLPMVNKRIYNLQSKQLCKLFARVFGGCIYDSMLEDLEQGDAAETVAKFHEKAVKCPPAPKANLSLQQVDRYLDKLSKLTREEDQINLLDEIARTCTANDLKMIVRLIKHDIRINAGPRHILDALNPAAYEAFHASLDLKEVVRQSLAEG
ncbi:DNA ligase 3-like, partial [Tropilaelaps mercedesae]